MAQNIFDATLDPNNDIKVNNFDWSHANNLTTQIGRITPIFCDMVPAKTSFRVNPRFGLQFMPMVFPIQTRMKARIMWFRYPLRALWKDYKDFVGNFREGLEEPYLDINTSERLKKMCSTGSLGDYLGLPTTLVGSYGGTSTPLELSSSHWYSKMGYYIADVSNNRGVLAGTTTYTQTVQNEDGTRTELIKTSLVDEDGKKYGLSFTQSDEGLEGVEYVELDNGTQVRQARSLYDLATSGISIPDLRMVNCYQKFLELNMRKGYSYKDIVEGRFDVKVRYADLLMPEFFGGVSRDIDVNSITQTVDQNVQGQTSDYDKALGSQAGLAGVRGEANANIECFCDEESIIMGLLIVTPLPVYTQLLPKHFTYRGLMEHYQPEFNLIGFQPIKYNEVCPIQAYNDNPDSLTETFGYNRPWYEFAQKYDVAHGLFRTSLSNFLMHRVFDQKPQLAQSFLTVDPEQVTDVFAVTETTDKIYGQIWLDITCKLPIARVAIPRLD